MSVGLGAPQFHIGLEGSMSDTMKKTIYESAHRVVTLEDNGEEAILTLAWYPMTGYGNRVETWVILDRKTKKVTCGESRYNWNGSGSTTHAVVRLSDEEFRRFEEMLREVREPEDVKRLAGLVREVEERLDREWGEAFDELFRSICDASYLRSIVGSARNIDINYEGFREYLRNCIVSYLESEGGF